MVVIICCNLPMLKSWEFTLGLSMAAKRRSSFGANCGLSTSGAQKSKVDTHGSCAGVGIGPTQSSTRHGTRESISAIQQAPRAISLRQRRQGGKPASKARRLVRGAVLVFRVPGRRDRLRRPHASKHQEEHRQTHLFIRKYKCAMVFGGVGTAFWGPSRSKISIVATYFPSSLKTGEN